MSLLKKHFIIIIFVSLIIAGSNVKAFTESKELHNPIVEKDTTMEAGQTVLYDCVYYGSYPQSMVDKNDVVYSTLANNTEFDKKNECIVDGKKYRKATAPVTGEDAYFEYEPIKWRVLEINDNDILLLADKALDAQPYQHINNWDDDSKTNWKLCSLRRFLNNEFYDVSFSEIEKNDIKTNQTIYLGIDDEIYDEGETLIFNTETVDDKVFLLLYEDLYKLKYGFSSKTGWDMVHDEARRCIATDYAKSCVGESIKDPCSWWCIEIFNSNSPTHQTSCLTDYNGWVYTPGNDFFVNYTGASVRPVIRVDRNSELWSYAGTVSSKEMKDYPATNIPIPTTTPNPTEPSPSPQQPANSLQPPQASQTPLVTANKNKVTIPTVAKVTNFKVTAKKRGFALSWKKKKDVSGYQIQVCTKKNFISAKKIEVKNKNKYTISKLKSKKKYYIRIRAYKMYKAKNGKLKKACGKYVVISKNTK